MKNNKIIICVLILFSLVTTPLLYYISDNPALIQGKLIHNSMLNKPGGKSKVIYDLNVPLDNHLISRMKIYEAKTKEIEEQEIKHYVKVLKLNFSDIKEDVSAYRIQNDHYQLIVDKNTGLIQYKNLEINIEDNNKKINPEEAIEIFKAFAEKLNLPLNYRKCLVEDIPDKKLYQLRFINSIEGILNYGYCTKAELSHKGEILNFNYYQLVYKPRQIVSIKTKKEAYEDLLKIPFEEEAHIDIQKIELVYFTQDIEKKNREKFEDEFILIPCYRFFGEISKNKSFEYFIPALKE